MAFYRGPNIVTNGLTYYLDAGNIKSYPTTGTTWTDLINRGTASLINGPVYSSSSKGGIVFDGINDYVDTSLLISNPFSTAYTFCMFTKPSVIGEQMVMSTGQTRSSGTNDRLYIGAHNTNGWSIGIQSSAWTPTGTPVTTNWTYVVLSMGTGTATLYVNGVSIQTKAYTSYTMTGTLWLAGHDGASANQFNGTISNFSIYNRVLSLNEIQQNYNALKTRYNL